MMDNDRPEETGCSVCNRAMYKKDVDKLGRCPDCAEAHIGTNTPVVAPGVRAEDGAKDKND